MFMGVFNMHLDITTSSQLNDFKSVLDSADLVQFVNFPTHNKGNMLDRVCCSGVLPFNFTYTEFSILDHKPVYFFIFLFFWQKLNHNAPFHFGILKY